MEWQQLGMYWLGRPLGCFDQLLFLAVSTFRPHCCFSNAEKLVGFMPEMLNGCQPDPARERKGAERVQNYGGAGGGGGGYRSIVQFSCSAHYSTSLQLYSCSISIWAASSAQDAFAMPCYEVQLFSELLLQL